MCTVLQILVHLLKLFKKVVTFWKAKYFHIRDLLWKFRSGFRLTCYEQRNKCRDGLSRPLEDLAHARSKNISRKNKTSFLASIYDKMLCILSQKQTFFYACWLCFSEAWILNCGVLQWLIIELKLSYYM